MGSPRVMSCRHRLIWRMGRSADQPDGGPVPERKASVAALSPSPRNSSCEPTVGSASGTMDLPSLSLADQIELQRFEEAMWQQAHRFDLTFQEERFASDFFEFGRSGRVYSRVQAIRIDSQPIAARLPLANLRFRVLDVHTVQLTYDSAVQYDGVLEYARRSSIWFRSPTGWVMRFHQGTPFKP